MKNTSNSILLTPTNVAFFATKRLSSLSSETIGMPTNQRARWWTSFGVLNVSKRFKCWLKRVHALCTVEYSGDSTVYPSCLAFALGADWFGSGLLVPGGRGKFDNESVQHSSRGLCLIDSGGVGVLKVCNDCSGAVRLWTSLYFHYLHPIRPTKSFGFLLGNWAMPSFPQEKMVGAAGFEPAFSSFSTCRALPFVAAFVSVIATL